MPSNNTRCTSIVATMIHVMLCRLRRVWKYQRGNQNPYMFEEQTTQWQKETVQKDKQWSTKHTYQTKDRVTGTPLKHRGELRCSGRVGSSCSTSDTRHVNLVTNPVKVMMRKEPGSVYDKWNISVVICDTAIPKRSTKSLLAATLYHRNPDTNHKLWNIVSIEIYILHVQVLLECCYINIYTVFNMPFLHH